MQITIFFLVVVAYVFFRVHPIKGRRNLIIISCLLLGLEASLRHLAVGPDTPNYYNMFETISNESWDSVVALFFVNASDWRDPMFYLIIKVFSYFIPSWQLFLFATSLLFFFALGRLFYKYIQTLEGVLLAITIYLTLFHIVAISGIRQEISMALSMLVIPWINENKWKKATIVIVLGSSIHISLLLFLFIIPFLYIKKTTTKLIFLLAICLVPVIAVSAKEIIAFMASFIQNDYYSDYANVGNRDNPIVYVSICTIISIYEFLNLRKLNIDNPIKFLVPSIVLMTLFVPLIFLNGSMIRIGQYFTIYIMLSLPFIFDRVRYRSQAYMASIVILGFLIIRNNSEYYFFWENVSGFNY